MDSSVSVSLGVLIDPNSTPRNVLVSNVYTYLALTWTFLGNMNKYINPPQYEKLCDPKRCKKKWIEVKFSIYWAFVRFTVSALGRRNAFPQKLQICFASACTDLICERSANSFGLIELQIVHCTWILEWVRICLLKLRWFFNQALHWIHWRRGSS